MAAVRPVVINEENVILGGNMRFKAMLEAGWKDIPVTQVKGWTPEQQREFVIKDNVSGGEWDWDVLANQYDLPTLESWGVDVPKDLQTTDVTEDEAPEVSQEEPISKLGEVYQLGRHFVMCGDSTKIEDVEKLMDGKKADMVFTDPPYGMDLDTDYEQLSNNNFGVKSKTYSKVIGDDKPFDMKLFSWIDCKEQFWWGADWYKESVPSGGSWFVWDKRVDENLDNMYGSAFELCWSKQRHQRLICRHKFAGFFGSADAKERMHPTQKAIGVCSWFIEKYSKTDNLIMDLFLGSGSTLIACEQTNRTCYGMELDPKYPDVMSMFCFGLPSTRSLISLMA